METLEKAPAKLNLSLDALFRHLDGFRQIQAFSRKTNEI